MIRERCSCGAEFESDEQDAPELWVAWRDVHACPPPTFDDRPIGGTAQVEQAPDYTVPELHLGFRAEKRL
jgi:hypothetical protein